ncbi:translation initiation factor eIF4e [Atractiella rhizophila]|nr:translation initiation factor eIF4e [Atractiella rhizophila]
MSIHESQSPELSGKLPSPPNTASHHPGGQAYEATLQVIGEFKTVETFCRYFNWTKRPSQLEVGSNVHVFKDGIKPMWEDTANQDGGKWVLTVKKPDNELLDRCWMWLVLALIGEVLDEKDEVCGAVVSLKPRGHRIQLWTRSKSDVEGINSLGKRLIKLLEIEQEPGIQFEFQSHGGAPPAGSVSQSTKFISINNYAPPSSGSIRRASNIPMEVGNMGPPAVPAHRQSQGPLGFAGFANQLGDKLNNPRRGTADAQGGPASGWRGGSGLIRGFGGSGAGRNPNRDSGSFSHGSTPLSGSREGSRQGSRVGSRATSPEPPKEVSV